MTVDRKLLEILVCPITKQPVSMLPAAKLESLNQKITASEVQNQAGETLTESWAEALITNSGSTLYPVLDSIPVMLESQSVATVSLGDW